LTWGYLLFIINLIPARAKFKKEKLL